jgi:hypothetical protein
MQKHYDKYSLLHTIKKGWHFGILVL